MLHQRMCVTYHLNAAREGGIITQAFISPVCTTRTSQNSDIHNTNYASLWCLGHHHNVSFISDTLLLTTNIFKWFVSTGTRQCIAQVPGIVAAMLHLFLSTFPVMLDTNCPFRHRKMQC